MYHLTVWLSFKSLINIIADLIFVLRSIFYQPEEFYMKPEQLDAAENGGVAVAYKKMVLILHV